ncbi:MULTISPECIES: hypothetical protein [unclassified Methylobacterium]|uniref:hypothetical protein n=1 Tax=unclassified Methylobacterium TaxID=2615210 RepID=UPI0011C1E20E|nr:MULTISPECIES: hypothetical protein [unclassified Methylobacterium]QEE38823.1 hypothetical protein FVA80_07450 [Methylobacterium sp. WL1]TXN53621.1 hypothetical protein FV241_27485 [Methylobacterium sp. WL2]
MNPLAIVMGKAPNFAGATLSVVAHSDAALLALASELEAAARPYLAYDRDAEVTSADPDCREAWETARRLYGTVKAVADRIFVHRPESLAGLLVLAHAAALTCSDSWEDNPDNGGQDGELLRLVCNALFRLVGVDWRGRALPGAEPPAAVAWDPGLAALTAEWCALRDRVDACSDGKDGAERKLMLQREILAHPCASLADLCAKLPLLREEEEAAAPPPVADEVPDMALAAWRGIVQDLEVLSGASVRPRVVAPPPQKAGPAAAPDAALIPLAEAAITEERAAIAVCEACDHDTPPGTFARSMQFLELVTAMDAQTPAGLAAKARVMLNHAPEPDDLDGDWRCQLLAISIARDAARLGMVG